MDILLFIVNVKNLGLFKSPYHYRKIFILCWVCAHMYKTIISKVV
jgi:hypothetical protein